MPRTRELLACAFGIRLGNLCFEGVSSGFFGRGDLVLLSEKHCSRVINETMGEIAGRKAVGSG